MIPDHFAGVSVADVDDDEMLYLGRLIGSSKPTHETPIKLYLKQQFCGTNCLFDQAAHSQTLSVSC